jgi:hypothetical protein
MDSSQQDDPFLGRTLRQGSAGLCHNGRRPCLSHLLPKFHLFSCILGQALYIESKEGKLLGTRKRIEEYLVKKHFLSILIPNQNGCRTSRPTMVNVSFNSRRMVATREHVSSATPRPPRHLPSAGGQEWHPGVS